MVLANVLIKKLIRFIPYNNRKTSTVKFKPYFVNENLDIAKYADQIIIWYKNIIADYAFIEILSFNNKKNTFKMIFSHNINIDIHKIIFPDPNKYHFLIGIIPYFIAVDDYKVLCNGIYAL
jgi:hypothetical protein